MTGGLGLWLRWSRRDLRGRWLLVATIALVIAVGTGLATGFGSMESWRVRSNDASFARLAAHDLRLTLAEGAEARTGQLRGSVAAMDHPEWVTVSQERLVAPTQIDASTGRTTVLTPGRIVGVPVAGPQTGVDRLWVEEGRGLRPGDAGKPVALIEASYADFYGLPPEGTLRIAEGTQLRYVGHGGMPEYFLVIPPGLGFGTDGSLGVLFLPLETAQKVTGRPRAVNELAVRLAPGVDPDAAGAELTAAIGKRLPGYGVTVTRLDQEDAHRLLYKDAEGDQQFMNVFALLVLAAAALGAFTLMSRVVDAQRREIGIGMALGVPGRVLAVRPLAMGVQVALLGVLFGVGVGYLITELLRMVLEDFFPLPVIVTPFETALFARGAAIGFLLPLVASVYPVIRAVRVPPIEAIQVSARAAKAGLAPLLRRVPLPGGSLWQMAVRGALRAPRRTLLTSLGIAAVISMVMAFGGTIDSFNAILDRTQAELAGQSPSRLVVDLDGFLPRDSAAVRGIARSPAVGRAEPGLRLPGELRASGERQSSIETVVELVDPESRIWHPTVARGAFPAGGEGILLSEEAARDLGVGVGDSVILRHPRRVGAAAVGIVDTRLTVTGLHRSPMRFLSFLDSGQAGLMGLTGLANTVAVVPASGVSRDEAIRALFGKPGVATVQSATALTEAVRDRMNDFGAILQVGLGSMLVLALLIAFNTTSISSEERRREQATMMAFGVPVRGVLRVAVIENLTIGLVATALGIGGGFGVLLWLMRSLYPETLPELGAVIEVRAGTWLATVFVGILAVALAPLLTRRRIARLDVPSTLRVVE
jgi:putative ABC transport system permease protein